MAIVLQGKERRTVLKVDLLRFVLTQSENQALDVQTSGTIRLSRFVCAQPALRPDQLAGCLASLYGAARSKTSVDRER